jgi:hypothetical protein
LRRRADLETALQDVNWPILEPKPSRKPNRFARYEELVELGVKNMAGRLK